MSSSGDAIAYEKLRSATVANQATMRRVEVNQRALIDKILARYAAKHAVYRELLANSDDAGATEAQLLFRTSEDMCDGGSGKNKRFVETVVYRNNGKPFRPEDWDRLQRIAEGNPDETKIGAFGVGVSVS